MFILHLSNSALAGEERQLQLANFRNEKYVTETVLHFLFIKLNVANKVMRPKRCCMDRFQHQNKKQVYKDVVDYLSTINAPATDMATVHETLTYSDLIRPSLGLRKIVIVFDQALSAKAAEIV